tara:strand:+ start:962 stop:1201 length:240 start_codon:yes stop_codon:yes gene_type:complete
MGKNPNFVPKGDPAVNVGSLPFSEVALLMKLCIIHEDKILKDVDYHLNGPDPMPNAANALAPSVLKVRSVKRKLEKSLK